MVRKDISITQEDLYRYTDVRADTARVRSLMETSQQECVTNIGKDRVLTMVVHNTILSPDGLSLGGLRWNHYSDGQFAVHDARRLARGMAYKHATLNLMMTRMALNGEATLEEVEATRMGGAKAVLHELDHIPQGDDRQSILRQVALDLEKIPQYVTAPDMNTDISDMDYMSTFAPDQVVCKSRELGGSGDPSIITANGVYHAIRAAVDFKFGMSLDDQLDIGIKGVGKVGSHLLQMLMSRNKKANIIITDLDKDRAQRLASKYNGRVRVVAPDDFFDQRMDVFSPNAKGSDVNAQTIERLCQRSPHGVAIAGGANNQIVDHHTAEAEEALFKSGCTYVPDFVANLGGILNVIYEMPLVKSRFKGKYTALRPMNVASGVYDLSMEILRNTDGLSAQTTACDMALENIARWSAVAGRR